MTLEQALERIAEGGLKLNLSFTDQVYETAPADGFAKHVVASNGAHTVFLPVSEVVRALGAIPPTAVTVAS